MAWRSSIPYSTDRVGAAAIYCSDGRYNEQFDEFLHERLGLPRYDRLTLPGGAAALGRHIAVTCEDDALIKAIEFLVGTHRLERMVLIAHQGCGFYLHRLCIPEGDARRRQHEDLTLAAERIRAIHSRLRVEAYFATPSDGRVAMEEVPV
jgi:hypothetical protein